MSKKGLGNAEYAGKVKTQTFKQFQLDRLIKGGTVIPASKLAEAKELELQRIRDLKLLRMKNGIARPRPSHQKIS